MAGNHRSTLRILATIVVLGGFIWFQETWRARTPSKEQEMRKIFDLDPATLTALQFRITNDVVECRQQGGVWLTGNPEKGMGRADTAKVLHTVAGLNGLGKGTTITSKHLRIRGVDPAEYGFDQPAIEIVGVDNKGRHAWQIGRQTPLGNMLYLRKEGSDEIYTISDKLLAVVPFDAERLRDTLLFHGEATSVRRVEIRGAGGFIQILKSGQAEWNLQQPVAAPADPAAVDGFIDRLRALRIEDFVADNVSDFSVYGLQGEIKQISLGSADGSSRMLVLGDAYPGHPGMVYARRADDTSVFAVNSNIMELLDIPAERFRDVGLLSTPAASIDSITIARSTERLELASDGKGTWHVASPAAWEADGQAVQNLIEIWKRAVIIEFDIPGSGGTAPDWTLSFGASALGRTNRIEVLPGNGKRDGLLVRRGGETAACRINIPTLSDATIDPLVYKSKLVWQLDRRDIARIAQVKGGVRQVVERQAENGFVPAETNGTVRVDAAAAARLVELLERIEARTYITNRPRDLETYGLAEPSLELHIGLTGTNVLGRVLLLGRETPDGFYAMVKGRDVVFSLDKILVAALSADLLVEPQPTAPAPVEP